MEQSCNTVMSLHREDDIFHKTLFLFAPPPSVELITLVLKSVLLSLNLCQPWAKMWGDVFDMPDSSPSSDFITFKCWSWGISVHNWLHTSTLLMQFWAIPDTGNASTWGDMRVGDEMRGVMYLNQRIAFEYYPPKFWSSISFTRFSFVSTSTHFSFRHQEVIKANVKQNTFIKA